MDSRMKKIKSFCPLCEIRCSIDMMFEGKRVTRIGRGNFLPGEALCYKGLKLKEILNSPKRLRRPLRRTGARGSNQWQAITWDEALSLLSEKILELRDRFGPWSLAWDQGYGPSSPYLKRFLNCFGSPNILSRSHLCSQPRKIPQTITFGGMASPDVDNSQCIVIWGRDKLSTGFGAAKRLLQAVAGGASLIVVDPRKSAIADKQALWLPLRPGTDGALALGMGHVIVREGLYDKDFVQKHCTGFKELVELTSRYTPERTAEITWLPAEDIVTAARMYARERPACIEMGNGLDHHTNSFQTVRAILSLMAITGNLNTKGGNIMLSPVKLADVSRPESLAAEYLKRRVGAEAYPFLGRFRHAMAAPVFIDTLLEEKPERPRALIVTKGNPLVTLAQTQSVKDAIQKLDFIAVSDFVLTETASYADLIFPAAPACEGWDLVLYDPARNDHYYAGMAPGILLNRPLPRRDDNKTDTEFIFALAEKVGLKKEFWNGSIENSLEERLHPLNLSLDDFRDKNTITLTRTEAAGFKTPSGKVELTPAVMEEAGYPLGPLFCEPPESPVSRMDLFEDYPLVLTGHKSKYFVHSAFRWVDSLRQKDPYPLAEMHPDTAQQFGISDGQKIDIRSARGNCWRLARITPDIRPGIISCVHGWAGEANVNRLTSNDQRDPVLSCNPLRSSLCAVKAL